MYSSALAIASGWSDHGVVIVDLANISYNNILVRSISNKYISYSDKADWSGRVKEIRPSE